MLGFGCFVVVKVIVIGVKAYPSLVKQIVGP